MLSINNTYTAIKAVWQEAMLVQLNTITVRSFGDAGTQLDSLLLLSDF